MVYDTVTHFIDLSIDKRDTPMSMPWKFVLHVNEV
jgi:hypothetical protein